MVNGPWTAERVAEGRRLHGMLDLAIDTDDDEMQTRHRAALLEWLGCAMQDGMFDLLDSGMTAVVRSAAAEPEAKDENPVRFCMAANCDTKLVGERQRKWKYCAAHEWRPEAKDEPKATARQVADMLSDEFLRRGQYEGIAASEPARSGTARCEKCQRMFSAYQVGVSGKCVSCAVRP